MDLQGMRESAAEIARAAGAELMKRFEQPHQERTKRHAADIVTEADIASEAVIVPLLKSLFPDHRIISEEGGGTAAGTADYTWYIDPLDGTSNYASNIPFFTVSIGLADQKMTPLVGVVYDPFSDELYTAAQGLGATLNGRSLRVSDTDALQQAMLCTGFVYETADSLDNNLREWGAMNRQVRGVRRFGSVALELAYIAAGRLDGLWERGLNLWDIMGGIVLVREAGGRVTDYSGQESERLYQQGQVLATNGRIHADVKAVLEGK